MDSVGDTKAAAGLTRDHSEELTGSTARTLGQKSFGNAFHEQELRSATVESNQCLSQVDTLALTHREELRRRRRALPRLPALHHVASVPRAATQVGLRTLAPNGADQLLSRHAVVLSGLHWARVPQSEFRRQSSRMTTDCVRSY